MMKKYSINMFLLVITLKYNNHYNEYAQYNHSKYG